MQTPMFSRENSKLQMIETAHVNKRKQVSTNQHPIGDDVSERTADAEGSDVLGMTGRDTELRAATTPATAR